MKRNIIAVVMVSLMALTLVSGAGILRVQAVVDPTPAELANALDCTLLAQQQSWHWGLSYTAGSGVQVLNDLSAVGGTQVRLLAATSANDQVPGYAEVYVTNVGQGTFTFHVSAPLNNNQFRLELYEDGNSKVVFGNPYDGDYSYKVITSGAHQLMLIAIQQASSSDQLGTVLIDNVRWQPAVTKASILQDLATLKATVKGMPNSAFYSGTKSALLAIIDAATLQAKYGRYSDAANTLQSKFIPRVDGCALRMTPDMLDLVRTCPAQAPLYEQATSLVSDLQWLQANPP